MPTIYQFAVRPTNTSVAYEAQVECSSFTLSQLGAGFASPPAIESVVVDVSNITIDAFPFAGPWSHTSSDWQIDESGGDFSTPAKESLDDASNLESIVFTRAGLTEGASYICRTRQTDSTVGDSEWSASFSFVNEEPDLPEWPNSGSLTERSPLNAAAEALGVPVDGQTLPNNPSWLYSEIRDEIEVVADASTPSGGGRAFRYLYDAAKIDGIANYDAPAKLSAAVNDTGLNEMYVGVVFKWSSNFKFHHIEDKLVYWQSQGGGNCYLSRNNLGGGLRELRISHQGASCLNGLDTDGSGSITMQKDVWYRLEWHRDRSGTPLQESVWRSIWDGSAWGAPTQIINVSRTDCGSDESKWVDIELNPVYGGTDNANDAISTDMYLYVDVATVRY